MKNQVDDGLDLVGQVRGPHLAVRFGAQVPHLRRGARRVWTRRGPAPRSIEESIIPMILKQLDPHSAYSCV